MYGVLRHLLFQLPPEQAHNMALNGLDFVNRMGALKLVSRHPAPCPVTVMGLEFPNPVGLAAGLDKNADHLDALGNLGFGFIEVGTVTPLAQPGNPKPRMFRLPEHQAIINRMGFNNEGLDHLIANVKKRRYRGVLGINVGKNKDTPNEESEQDYRKGIAAVYPYADYITVNVSSPNTPGLRDLQFGDSLKQLLHAIKDEQLKCQESSGRYVPVAVKIAPDMDDEGIRFVAEALLEAGIDGVIATNTTISREAVQGHKHEQEAGGLSGAPVRDPSLRVIRGLYAELGDRLPIIGVGGISDGESAAEKIRAGAKLVQVYTGFIYRGPALINEAVEAIRKELA
ncbi:quinone-dependent dihydroorotate dehydrogenase [Marinobacter persicus]|mgnify:CR=1 FL=1|jgi:dihydroorotate dehydrogenase|uniref:Dihydroorotate dehydrogenase (quinone) n=1 Tax=Marinobacter persicus TaxID=930118 RepID=A0A2S6G429_9GAMM|nr:quinone-dependent dihydroorotate dehydrogenase [Marinobacter persicus]KXS54132.1 MAG: dihydro-orotate oxidase, FMN-linked [Marinobacter sp. T13-3]PPK50552.1 dihydroorotate oxidase A [Marinobacter persicus]PPK53827.1 dihydroorotate oxidase A [Marinobacter persicus]PPK57063.1 dihydroorotate oxidase A [Marinobacter persicus]